jgi:uncharacterized cupin superfamily protein
MTVTTAKLVEPLPPITLPQHEIVEGTPNAGGQFTAATADEEVTAGFWSCNVGRYEFAFDYDEFVYIIRGAVTVTVHGTGATHVLEDGDTALFPQGVTTTWEITRPVTKYFVARAGR